MSELVVTRLLQNPLGAEAPEGVRGDIVRVTDGASTIYLDPRDFDRQTEESLRALLSDAARVEAARANSRSRAADTRSPRVPGQRTGHLGVDRPRSG